MKPPLGPGRTRWLAGVLGTLTAGFLFAPAPARADCGDYVTIGGQGAMTGHANVPESPHPVSGPRDGHKPCTGPRCSGGTPVVPFAPFVPPAPPSGEDTGMASAGNAAQFGSPPAERRDDTTYLRLIRFASSVYHPPR